MNAKRVRASGTVFFMWVMLSSRETRREVLEVWTGEMSRASIRLELQKSRNSSLRDLYSKRGAAREMACGCPPSNIVNGWLSRFLGD